MYRFLPFVWMNIKYLEFAVPSFLIPTISSWFGKSGRTKIFGFVAHECHVPSKCVVLICINLLFGHSKHIHNTSFLIEGIIQVFNNSLICLWKNTPTILDVALVERNDLGERSNGTTVFYSVVFYSVSLFHLIRVKIVQYLFFTLCVKDTFFLQLRQKLDVSLRHQLGEFEVRFVRL